MADTLLARVLYPTKSQQSAVTINVGVARRSVTTTPIVVMGPTKLPRGDIDPDVLVKLSTDERGDALLAAGDIAAGRGDAQRADARWTEAQAIVGDQLVAPRKKRVGEKVDLASVKLSDDLQGIQADFDRFFDSASSGNGEGATVQAAALRTRVQNVKPPAAAEKLKLAIASGERSARLVRAKNMAINAPSTGGWMRPQPPIKPSDEDMRKNPWMRSNYDRQYKEYEQNLARFENRRSEEDLSKAYKDNEADVSAANLLNEARAQRDEGLAMAAATTQ
jgi:hypothetical protein